MYHYDFDGIGLTITTPAGSCYIQGEEGSELYEELESIEDDRILNSVLREYEHVCE